MHVRLCCFIPDVPSPVTLIPFLLCLTLLLRVIGSVVIGALRGVVLTLFPLQSYGQILRALEYLPHAVMYQFLLFYQLLRFRVLPKLYGLDKDVFELVRETVRCFDFDVGVPDAHQIGD